MAIDDNTVYGLTGAQVKELPEKINAVKGLAKVLTTDDYNANSSNWSDTDPANFNCIAMWRLDYGLYNVDSTTDPTIYISKNRQKQTNTMIVTNYNSSFIQVTCIGNGSGTVGKGRDLVCIWLVEKGTGNESTGSQIATLASNQLINNLNRTTAGFVLDASQGKVLKDMIDGRIITNVGAPTTTTVGTVGMLLEDTTNGKLYQCTAVDTTDPQNIVYTWSEVGAGGSGVVELTSADYNWPEDNPVRVAVWLLGDGVYSAPSADLAISTSTNMGHGGRFIKAGNTIFVWNNAGSNNIYIVSPSDGSQTNSFNLVPPTVVQTTGSSTSDVMSQNAVTTALSSKADTSAIPTVNNATLTIQANGTTVNTFTANASSNVTANIPSATTSRYGVTQLSDSTSSTSTALAATSSAVKSAYDLAETKAKITMSSTDPGEGVALAENEYIAVYGGDSMNLDYSTTEKATGGTWIDGSAIYKKTVNFGALPNNADKTVAHGISNLGRVIKLEGVSYDSSTSTYAPLPYASDSASAIDVSIVGSNIRIHTFTDRTAFSDTYITLYYTKSS